MGDYKNLEWRKNSRGLWAWFDGSRQVSGAHPAEGNAEYAYNAERMRIIYPCTTGAIVEIIDYETRYSEYSKSLAKNYSKSELEKSIAKIETEMPRATSAHLRAIEKTSSMQSNSQHRAKSRQVVDGLADEKRSLLAALEICELFPEHAQDGYGTQRSTASRLPSRSDLDGSRLG